MMPYEAAREVAWFVVIVFVGIACILARDIRKENKDGQ